MATIQVRSTSGISFASGGVNILLYGGAGVGKTVSLSGLPSPLIVSVEGGLLGLSSDDVPYVEVRSSVDLIEIGRWLRESVEAREYESVGLDSLSEVCDLVFEECRRQVGVKPAVLYPELRRRVLPLLSSFRSLPYHFVATAHELLREVGDVGVVYAPSVVGSRLTDDMPYVFDMVLRYVHGSGGRQLLCSGAVTPPSIVKDRTGRLPGVINVGGRDVLGRIVSLVLGSQSGSRSGSRSDRELVSNANQ